MIIEYIKQYLKEFKPYKPNQCWCYEDGIILSGSSYLYDATKDQEYLNFVISYLDDTLDKDGVPRHYDLNDYNIDDINSGKSLFWVQKYHQDDRYLKCINLLYKQLQTHPRTKVGNFFHKKRYPYQIWMDGLYMAQPFYSQYILTISKDYSKLDDILNQFENVRKYLYDEKIQLYMHAYDEQKVMMWADKITGRAPNVWSRAVGWFAMALVDVAGQLDPNVHLKIYLKLESLFDELILGMLKYQDADTNMWYQVVNKPEVTNNYLETSGSAMMAYSMLKAARIGFKNNNYQELGAKVYQGITKNMLYKSEHGRIHLKNICQVAGLDNQGRDGSIAYYLSEKIVEDESKGVAPFMMATAEMILSKLL